MTERENPESACVLSENERHAVVDVVAAQARYAVLARNPRHIWAPRRTRDENHGST